MNPDGTPDASGALDTLFGYAQKGIGLYGALKNDNANAAPAKAAVANDTAAKAADAKGPAALSNQTMLIGGGIALVLVLVLALRK